jgi:ketosteroid isomerase-like protein
MSRDDTTALIRRYLDAFNAKDFEAMLACLTDDVAMTSTRAGARSARRNSAGSTP